MPNDLALMQWSLVIATYQRGEDLQRCLALAVAQTRPPAEIIVVDASPDWEETRDAVKSLFAGKHPEIRWDYVPAHRRSLPAQRNQGIALATREIVFLIDDDSMMYPDCAAEILRFYEADADGILAGVNAINIPVPPDQSSKADGLSASEFATAKRYNAIARFLRRLLSANDIFVPYDAEFPRHKVPPSMDKLAGAPRPHMAGWGMTFRRSICLREPFEEILGYYAAGEDSDAGYRASRRGLLMTAFNARICHIGAGGGRLSPFVVAAMGALNPLVLHRIYSTNLQLSQSRSRRLLARRFFILLFKDLSKRRFSIPHARGLFFAWRHMSEIFARTPEELRQWYPQFLKELVERAG